MRIVQNTNFTTYTEDTIIKPKTALWMIKNDGAELIINNTFRLSSGLTFGIDALKILQPALQHYLDSGGRENVEIINETEFSVAYYPSVFASIRNLKVKFTLIETSLEFRP